jgi:hypothetical protein
MEPASLWYALLIAVFAAVIALGVMLGSRGSAPPADEHDASHDPTMPGVRHADEESPSRR